jgi:gluconate kinase
MPASLVDSQFADLEPPGPDEMAVVLDAKRPVEELVASAAAVLRY